MKVVLFCGGLGMRLRDSPEEIPKPMVPVGYRPILWHLMKYYAHFGHRDFILCLGCRADVVKSYFLDYDECLTNDFVLSRGGRSIDVVNHDIADWRIRFVDTGTDTNIAGRLVKVRPHLEGEDAFLANFADALCDLSLNRYVADFLRRDRVASFLSVRPTTTFHITTAKRDGHVERVQELGDAGIHMNGGFFVFRPAIFDYIREGEELVNEPFARLIQEGQLVSERYDGFWRSMDTFKDKQLLDDLYFQGRAPWEVWKRDEGNWPDLRPRSGHR